MNIHRCNAARSWTKGIIALLSVLALLGCSAKPEPATQAPTTQAKSTPIDPCAPRALPSGSDQTLPRNGGHDARLLGEVVLIETNRARCANGLQPLLGNAPLQQAAGLHSRDMARLEFFSHDSPVPGRKTLAARVTQVGYRFGSVAENIIEARYMAYKSGRKYQIIDPVRCAFAYADGQKIPPQSYASLAREVVERWMDSPGHRKNILTAGMRAHGFAIAPNKDASLCGGIYGTQVLAR